MMQRCCFILYWLQFIAMFFAYVGQTNLCWIDTLETVLGFLLEMRWGTSCGVSLLCCWSSDNVTGGPAAYPHQSLRTQWVRSFRLSRSNLKSWLEWVLLNIFFLSSDWEKTPKQTRKRNFSVSYLSRDRSSVEMYLSLLSDWDLDIAFMSAAKPFLQLKMDVKPSEDSKNSSSVLKQTMP